ncbi:MAG: DUF115 domain-containing protein [Herbinix sp.]|nr:DUF115 domain-containing protein [Herbinix sp.]
MNDQIYQLFNNNITIIDIINQIILNFRIQNYDKALRNATLFINQLDQSMPQLYEVAGQERTTLLTDMMEGLFQAQKQNDYVLLADLYELQILRFFIELQEDIIGSEGFEIQTFYYSNNCEAMNKRNPELGKLINSEITPMELLGQDYSIEYSSCGRMTLALSDKNGKYYLHSNGRISEVACALANSWYNENVVSYMVYGLGLGYHIKELSEIDDNINIEVYESDINIFKLAAAFADLKSLLEKPNINLIYDPDYTKLLNRTASMKKEERFIIHYPSLRNIKNTNIRENLENYFIQYSSIENQRKLLNGNFRENILRFDGMVDDLQDQFKDRDLYIVAAGPSLDKNYELLKNVGEKSIILATGTVFRKLLLAGIKPDYVIVTDANSRVYRQIAGQEDSSVPMIFLSTAYHGFARNYKGKKYMICQKDYDKAEQYAAKHGDMLFLTGGSVSTTALDLGITFACRRIIFLGLDLAYTDNYAHASDTSRRDITQKDDLRLVEDINGNKVNTSRTLDIYRKWIENRIRDVKNIEFIDATEGGAKIDGMKVKKLSECIAE